MITLYWPIYISCYCIGLHDHMIWFYCIGRLIYNATALAMPWYGISWLSCTITLYGAHTYISSYNGIYYWPIQCAWRYHHHQLIQFNSRVLVPLAHTISLYWPWPIHYYWRSVKSWAHTMLLYFTNRPTQYDHRVITSADTITLHMPQSADAIDLYGLLPWTCHL